MYFKDNQGKDAYAYRDIKSFGGTSSKTDNLVDLKNANIFCSITTLSHKNT